MSSPPRLSLIFILSLFGAIGLAVAAENGVSAKVANKAPIPADFPELNRIDRSWLTGSGDGLQSQTSTFLWLNGELLKTLAAYTPESIAATFGARMEKESDFFMKVALATVAAQYGDGRARKFISEFQRETDYTVTMSRLAAMEYLLRQPHPDPWVFDEVHQALLDMRQVSGMEKTNWVRGTSFTMADLAVRWVGLPTALAKLGNPQSVPVLIELFRRNGGRDGSLAALGLTGDRSAVAICLELLYKWDDDNTREGSRERCPKFELLGALGELQATAAVATLLKYVDSPRVIETLGKIGYEIAIDPLQQIVDVHGELESDPVRDIGVQEKRVFAARMALINLRKEEDPIPKWIEIVQDPRLDWMQRGQASWELGRHPDPRAIDPLLNLVKSDPKGEMIDNALKVLQNYKYKVAVEGLIGCFDADFTGQRSFMRKVANPAGVKGYLGEILQDLTGQAFGADQLAWRKWWNESGRTLDSLQ